MYLFVVELKTALLLFATQYVDRLKKTRFDAVVCFRWVFLLLLHRKKACNIKYDFTCSFCL